MKKAPKAGDESSKAAEEAAAPADVAEARSETWLLDHLSKPENWRGIADASELAAQIQQLAPVIKEKLKGIDGGPHKRWSMWFNSMIREEPYQGLNVD